MKNVRVTEDFVLFWNGIYSQWYPSKFEIDGVTYNCCEQYMMAKKAEFFNDKESHNKIMQSKHPKEQKALGRQVKNFDTNKWNQVCREFVYKGNLAKFKQDTYLKMQLLQTGSREIVEGSPYDKIWGIGMMWDDDAALDKNNWNGKNWLGEAIMRVRETIINDIKNDNLS